jgi:aldehyde:ferredoxin oxidoreductase
MGTPYLIEIMNRFDLLPVRNFRYGGHPDSEKVAGYIWKPLYDRRSPDGCWFGCTLACAHAVPHVHLRTGPYAGQIVYVDGPEYETLGGLSSNLEIFDPQDVLEINFYADTYGIDTISLGNSMAFAFECYEYGILTPEITGGLELNWGDAGVVLEMIHQMARGKDLGSSWGRAYAPCERCLRKSMARMPA